MNIFDLQATISLNSSGFMSGIQEAQGAIQGLGSGLSAGAVAVGNLASSAITSAASGLVDFGKAAMETGMSFDASMANVAAISGATGDELTTLRDKAKEMGATTKFTATEAADAFGYMAMAGWDASQMVDGISGIMNLAAASGTDLATTSDIVTDALTAFGLTAADSGHFADVLAAASSAANTNVELMGETFKYVAPLAGAMGYSVEDMATAIGIMANSGIKGSQAGTALRMAISQLANPSDKVAAALDKLGLSDHAEAAADFAYDLDDLADEMAAVDKATKNVEKAQAAYNKALSENGAGSEKTVKAHEKLVAAQDKLAHSNALLKKAKQDQVDQATWYNAALQDENGNALAFSETVAKLQRAFSGLSEAEQAEYAATIFGQNAMSGMLALVNAAPEDINKLSDAAYNSSFSMEEVAESVLNSGVAWDKYADKAWTVDDLLGEMAFNFAEAGHSAEELTEYLMSDYDMSFEDATTAVKAFQEAMESSSGTAERMADIMNNNLPGSITLMQSAFDGFKTAIYEKFSGPLKEAVDVAADLFSRLTDTINGGGGLRDVFATLGSFIKEKFTGLLENIELPPAMQGIADKLKEIFNAFKNVELPDLNGFATGAKNLFGAFELVNETKIGVAVSGIKGFLDAFKSADIAGLITEIAGGAADLFGAFGGAAVDVMEGVAAVVGDFIGAFVDSGALAEIIGKLAEGAKDLISGIMTGSADIIEGVGGGVKKFLNAFAESQVAEIIGDIAKNAADFFRTIASVTGDLISGIGSGIKTFIDGFDNKGAVGLIEEAARFIGDLFGFFTGSLSGIITAVADAFSGFGDKIAELWNTAGPSLSETAEAFHAFADNAKQSIDQFMAVCQPVIEWLASVFAVGIQIAIDAVIRIFGNLWNAAMNVITFLQEGFGAFVSLIKGDVTGAVEGFKAAWENIKEFFSNIVEIIVAPFRSLSSMLSDEGNKGVQAIKAPFEAAWEWFKSVGTNIVEGLKSGIASAWSGLTSWFEDKVGGLVDGVLGLLGIHSPSTVFAGIGENMVLGLREGWGDTFGGFESQVDRDVQRLTDTARIGFEDSAIGKSSAAGISSMFAANEYRGGGEPVKINLVLDGDVAASALYDPLQRTAFQKGRPTTGGVSQPA